MGSCPACQPACQPASLSCIPSNRISQSLDLLTLEQRERHGEEERPGADLALRKAVAARMRVQVVAETRHEVEIERGGHDDDDRDEEEEVKLKDCIDVLKQKGAVELEK